MSQIEALARGHDQASVKLAEAAALPMLGTLMTLFESSDDCMKIISADGQLASMNCNGRKAMEIDDFQDVAGRAWADLWPAETRAQVRRSLDQALAGQVARFEAFCPTAKGTPKWWEVTVAPIASDDGAINWALSSSRDITDRVTREQQLETLALEMRHRLRNAFGASAGLIKAMARSQPESREFAADVVAQLHNLAAVQASLLDFDDHISMHQLIMRLFETSHHRHAITFDCATQVHLKDHGAKALSMVIGELIANSAKYGALATEGAVQLTCQDRGSEVEILWSESKGSVVAPEHSGSSGQGRTLQERMMASIGGTISTRIEPRGFSATILFPRPSA